MLLVTLMMARQRGMSREREAELMPHIYHVAAAVEEALQMNDELKLLAEDFAEKEHTLLLGRRGLRRRRAEARSSGADR